ncbi:MAG: thioredoxin family protein [Hyphomicrobiaceae bacterium]
MGLDDEGTPPQWMFKASAALFVLFTGLAGALAFVTPTAPPPPAVVLSFDRPQLVVFESQSCRWCKRFRERVAPAYERSHLDRRAPLRYVDISAQRTAGYRLSRRVTSTPTFVLVDRQGREVSRIQGLPGGKGEFETEVEGLLTKLPDNGQG